MSLEFQSTMLQHPPNILTEAESRELELSKARPFRVQLILYERLADRYGGHPFFLVKIAAMYALCSSPSMALHYYRHAQRKIPTADPALEAVITKLSEDADQAAQETLAKDEENTYKGFYRTQPWKPTDNHRFPTGLPMAPEGHEDVRQLWRDGPDRGTLYQKYLMKLAIETNEIESTFLLTEGSTQDLVRRGLSEEALRFLPNSRMKDPSQISWVLRDTLAAYSLLEPLVKAEKPKLDRETICRIHACLMQTDRFKVDGTTCIVAGSTRSLTQKNVLVQNSHRMIQCCPFPRVDRELDYICKMANQWISSWRRNPFATASWIHLILVRCHPFEDGNGRLGRLLASIPLMRYGYPPIAMKLEQSVAYYNAINSAYNDDHKPFIDCMLKGMQDTLAEVKDL